MNLLEILKKNADNAKSYIDGLVSKKQDTLTFDTAPTEGSQNPVTSDGIQKAIAAKTVDLSNYPTKDGTGATGTWPISISGAATKASQDSNGKVITDTYLKKAGDTATGDITAPNFVGHLKGNADTATNADKLDMFHENSFLRCRGRAKADGEDTLWGQIGIKEYDEKRPEGVSGTYNYGAVVSLPSYDMRLDVWYNDQSSTNGDGLWYRTGYSTDKQSWASLLDSVNYAKFAPTLTGSGASGTWNIDISGTATKATQDADGNVIADTYLKKSGGTMSGALNFANYTWNIVGDDAYMGDHSVAGSVCFKGMNGETGIVLCNKANDADYARISYGGGNINFNKTIGGNISGNAATATTATHANDVADATMNMTVSTSTNGQTVTASGVIDELSSLTDSTDLTSMSKLRSFVGSVYSSSNSDWNNVISIRHRNGAGDGQNYGLLMYSRFKNTDSIKYKKQGFNGWTEERTLLDSSNYNSYAPTKTGSGASGTWGINITGNAATATTADNAKKLGGYALNTESTGGHFGTIPKVGTDGVMEVGKYIDWHSQNGGSADYTSRWEAQNNGTVTVGTINGTLNGNAATATKALNVPTSDVGGNIWIA